MKPVYHESETRGLADHGWLVSRHTFSFAGYHNPDRMNFGLLRVLNDDRVEPSMGFGTHPHDNMEIISIPLSGSLRHQDSMGNKHIISAGEVQVMSAGSGITHSEYNNSSTEDVNFLQIWVIPKVRNITPRYDQKRFEAADRHNRFQLVVSPEPSDDTVWINQDSWFSLAEIEDGRRLNYEKHNPANGVYFFVLEGSGEIDGQLLNRRDGLGLTEANSHSLLGIENLKVLAIEVPMSDSPASVQQSQQ